VGKEEDPGYLIFPLLCLQVGPKGSLMPIEFCNVAMVKTLNMFSRGRLSRIGEI